MTDQYAIDIRQSVIFPNFCQNRLLEVKLGMRFVKGFHVQGSKVETDDSC